MVAAIALMVAFVPTIVGLIAPPQGTSYTGISSTAPGDVNVYLSYLEQARQGRLVFQDLYTATAQHATLLNPFWLMFGLLGALLHLMPLATYLLMRAALGAAMLWVLWRCCAFFYSDRGIRRTAYVLSVFASGVGAWFMPFLDNRYHGAIPEHALPMDLWVSEAFTFLTLRHSPHFIAATALILLSVLFLIRSVERDSRRDALLAGASMLGLFSFHPFHVVSLGTVTAVWAGAVMFGWIGVPRRSIAHLAIAWSVAIPAVLFHVLLTVFDPVSSGRATQNILLTTPPLVTIISYGFLLLCAILGGRTLVREQSVRTKMLVLWGFAHVVSLYLPIFFNRRLTHGLNIALALIAAPLCYKLVKRLSASGKKQTANAGFVAALAVLAFGTSNLWIFAQDLSYVSQKGRAPEHLFYVSNDYKDAFRWLERNGNEQTVVLSGVITGNLVPAWSGRKVVIGHSVETLDFKEVRESVITFFSGDTTDAWRLDFLKKNAVTHMVLGYREQAIIEFDPAAAPYLVTAYRNAAVTIYRAVY